MAQPTTVTGLLKIILPLAAGVLLLTSCISVNEHLTVNGNGSGSMALSYRIARIALDLPQPERGLQTIPLPTRPGDFAAAVRRTRGLTLESFTPAETTGTVGADAAIAFGSVGELSQVLGASSGVSFSLTKNGTSTLFRQLIYPGNPKGVNSDTLALAEDLFGDYRLVFTLRAPDPVQSVSLGSISSDRVTASYTTTIPAVLQARAPVVWEVKW